MQSIWVQITWTCQQNKQNTPTHTHTQIWIHTHHLSQQEQAPASGDETFFPHPWTVNLIKIPSSAYFRWRYFTLLKTLATISGSLTRLMRLRLSLMKLRVSWRLNGPLVWILCVKSELISSCCCLVNPPVDVSGSSDSPVSHLLC